MKPAPRARLVYNAAFRGAVAQLVERSIRIAEVRGSTPLGSTRVFADPVMPKAVSRSAVVICAAAVLISLTMGVRQTFGLFLSPLGEELSLSRESFSAAVALQNLLWGFLSPVFGGLADRFGAAKAAFGGALLYVGGLLCMSFAGDGATVALGQGLVGMGIAGAGFSVALGAVGKTVAPEKRVFALGVVTAAGSFGQFAIVPLAQQFIAHFGWRGALVGLAAVAALMAPAAAFLRAPRSALAPASDPAIAVTRAALSNRSYVLLTAGFFVCGFQVVFIATHLPAYLGDLGMAPIVASVALMLVGLFNIFGSLGCGWLGDRCSKKNSLLWFYLLRSVVIAGFVLLPASPASAIVFGALIGFLWLGTVPLTSGLVAVFFGARHMSMLYGIVFVSHQLGSALGAWLSGYLYEQTGSYDSAWMLAIALGIVAAALHYPIRENSDETFRRRYDTSAAVASA